MFFQSHLQFMLRTDVCGKLPCVEPQEFKFKSNHMITAALHEGAGAALRVAKLRAGPEVGGWR